MHCLGKQSRLIYFVLVPHDDIKMDFPPDTKIVIQTESTKDYDRIGIPEPLSPYSQPPSPYRSQYSQPPSPYPSHEERPPSPYRTESKIQWDKEVPTSFKPENFGSSITEPPAALDDGKNNMQRLTVRIQSNLRDLCCSHSSETSVLHNHVSPTNQD